MTTFTTTPALIDPTDALTDRQLTASAFLTDDATADRADAPLAPVDLHAIGYEKAEQHRGNANALENLLNRVLRGYLVEERNDDGQRQKHQQRIDDQVLNLEKQAEEARTGISKINGTELPALRDAVARLDEEIHQIRTDEAAGLRNPNHLDRLQLRLYGSMVVLATLFVYLFYVSAFYSAFFRDLAGELTTAGPEKQAGVLAAIFARVAFGTLDFHWVGPLLLFMFGVVLHILYGHKTRMGRLGLGVVLLLVFFTDGLIAWFVEAKNFELKLMMGLVNEGDHHFYASPVFWMVIMMGFVAAMAWSVILHTYMVEYGKKDVSHLTALDVQHRRDKQATLKGQMNDLTGSLAELEGQITRIDLDIKALLATRQLVVFSPAELEKYVTDFYDGWLTYVNNRMGNDGPLREACDTVIRGFYARHLNGG